MPGVGTDDPTNHIYYTQIAVGGQNGVYTSGGQAGFTLNRPNGNVVDAVAVNSFAFPTSANVPGAAFVGAITGVQGNAGIKRGPNDTNSASDFTITNGTTNPPNLQSYTGAGATVAYTVLGSSTQVGTGTVKVTPTTTTTYVATATLNGCSTTDTVTVNVLAVFKNIKVLDVRTINPSCALGPNQPVEVMATNIGNQNLNLAQDSLLVTVTANGTPYTLTVNQGNFLMGDTLTFIVNGVDLSAVSGNATTYALTGRVTLTADPDTSDNKVGPKAIISNPLTINAGPDVTVQPGASTTLTATTQPGARAHLRSEPGPWHPANRLANVLPPRSWHEWRCGRRPRCGGTHQRWPHHCHYWRLEAPHVLYHRRWPRRWHQRLRGVYLPGRHHHPGPQHPFGGVRHRS